MMKPQKDKPQRVQEPQGNPGVDVGDEIYVNHRAGPRSGRVVAHGEHGATVDVGGQHCKVHWHHVLGAKKRAVQHYNVVEEGEDGVIVEDSNGRRRYLNIAPDAREDKMIVKALDGHRLVLFMKADPVAGRNGLTKKTITDKNGTRTNKWVRVDADAPRKVAAGEHVGFVNGEFKGQGAVTAAGEHGLTVRDRADGIHRVPHGALSHHWDGDGEPDCSPHESGAETAKKPEKPDDAASEKTS